MAASTTPRPTRVSSSGNPALAALDGLAVALPAAVALSGGADSTALLMAACETWPGRIHAIHIHHGLQDLADEFERHCQTLCAQLAIPLRSVRVKAGHAAGESPEDAARKARYLALAAAAASMGLRAVLLGHHGDDQVETLLLALSRGAGLPGLAAMPAQFERHGMVFHRPLLRTSGGALREWLVREQVAFVEDPTNRDVGYTRNRIRHEILPALERAFPQFRETFARSARHAAQAQELLDELAAADMVLAGNPPRAAALRALSRARRANLLRHWLRSSCDAVASTAQMEELLDQIEACTTRGHAIRIKVGAGRVELQQGALRYVT
jgi:tRNA(Ile)-lysidine synthase